MRKKNIILTLYLASPIVVVIGLVALIFVTLDKEKLMADSPAIGSGAGDTGDANAIGQWLMGRDPDAVSLATKAKRERLLIDPRDWPGGIELRIPVDQIGTNPSGWAVELRHDASTETVSLDGLVPVDANYTLMLAEKQVHKASLWLVEPEGQATRIYTELRIPATDLAVSDPMVVGLTP